MGTLALSVLGPHGSGSRNGFLTAHECCLLAPHHACACEKAVDCSTTTRSGCFAPPVLCSVHRQHRVTSSPSPSHIASSRATSRARKTLHRFAQGLGIWHPLCVRRGPVSHMSPFQRPNEVNLVKGAFSDKWNDIDSRLAPSQTSYCWAPQ